MVTTVEDADPIEESVIDRVAARLMTPMHRYGTVAVLALVAVMVALAPVPYGPIGAGLLVLVARKV